MNTAELNRMYDFTGRNIVVTGGAGVLGGEVASGLVGCGANVAILDRDPRLADRVLERIELMDKAGLGRAIVVGCDVLDKASIANAQEVVEKELGPVDSLINAAGGNKPGATANADLSFFDLPEDALRFVFDLNILGTIFPSQVFAKSMAERGAGNILNFSSMNSFRPLTRVVAYSAAKAGVSNFTQWLAVHMAQEYSPNIRVNAVAPGFFLTDQNRFLLTEAKTGALTPRGQSILSHTPMKRFGTPEDLLGTILWLLSPAAAFVTGIVVPIDGGFSAFSGV